MKALTRIFWRLYWKLKLRNDAPQTPDQDTTETEHEQRYYIKGRGEVDSIDFGVALFREFCKSQQKEDKS